MNVSTIANILYNMSLDMDYTDSIEFADDEIAEIARAIESAGNDSLFQCLSIIAECNKTLYNWHIKKGGADDDES